MFSDAQAVFIVFYAILFGAMLGSIAKFLPFQWGQLFLEGIFAKRLLLSIFLLNIGPVGYFLWVFSTLQGKALCLCSLEQKVFSFLVVFSALGVFSFYRWYHIVFCWDRNRNIFWKNDNCKNDADFCTVGKDCWSRIKRKRNLHCDNLGHLIGSIFYLLPFFILFSYIKFKWDVIWTTVLFIILYVILAGMFRMWRNPL